ncbi:Succinate dehydrogenase subunit 6 [Hibiscus syriacus]|uniref:Succinate dehydrogenase subunit 6 n=1 Tax=Hibiscus syriacus TaxID=106335 RepID=A0A6A3C0P4_HIBSY|nr:succinate dehydrogenase subunit 6, mitochondrial-like [Hibiscus syriacus]KAE8720812.1 Succinate dehydrogenase subunit 6 [Hibiscus syriacus]
MGDSSSDSFLKKHCREFKEFWAERFPYTDVYSRFISRQESLPSWSESDVNEFIASDPVHGPILKTTREAANIALAGSAIGAVSTAGLAWKYSRSLHGAGLALLGGGVFGWTFGQEVANHWHQLYRLDTMAAQVKFMEWWEKKCQRRS